MSLFKRTLNNKTLNYKGILVVLKRCKSSSKLKEYDPCEKALKYFDDFYKAVFDKRWPSVRLGLLSKQKYFAVINNLGDIKETEKKLQNQGAFNLRTFLEVQKDYVEETRAKNNAKENNENYLADIIQQHQQQEEEKETSFLHPEGLEFKAKVDFHNQQNDENEISDEYIYKPEESESSLESDLKMSEIDKSRLIMPDAINVAGILNEFIPATKLRGAEEYISESDYFKYYRVKPKSLYTFENENELEFPENLLVYTFDRGEVLDFPEPVNCCNNVYEYLKLDGGDLLAALALNVKPEDRVLDMCSNSGNISYCIFQMFRSSVLICTGDRGGKVKKFFSKYLYGDWSTWSNMLFVTSDSVDENNYSGLFDKILVDVPSTFDKTALFEKENNIFHICNIKKRLKLPEVQTSLLLKAMKLVRPGGTIVYTTSTLSPVQNEGVVNEALNIIHNEQNINFTIKKLSPALEHTSFFFNYGNYLNLKFGILVVPFLPVNFGPRYISKLVRNEEPSVE